MKPRVKTKSERREKRKRPRMAISGRGVFIIQRLSRRRGRIH